MKISDLLEEYSQYKEKLAFLRNEYDEKERSLKDKMLSIANNLKEYSDTMGLKKLSSDKYTVSWGIQQHPRIENSEEFFNYIVKNNRFDLLEKRVAKLAILTALNEEKEVIPGIAIFSEIKPLFRKI